MNKTTLNSQKEKHSTLSLRRATPEASSASPRGSISIHALLAESDTTLSHNYNTTIISIHALLAESDRVGECFVIAAGVFLSTLSLRRATCSSRWRNSTGRYFYPRSPCGERPAARSAAARSHNFYPRSPCGERPILGNPCAGCPAISIHALLAESDSKSAQNSGALLRIWNKFYGDCIFMLTGKAVFYPFCPCFFHIFWCEGTGNFMIAFPSH